MKTGVYGWTGVEANFKETPTNGLRLRNSASFSSSLSLVPVTAPVTGDYLNYVSSLGL